MLNVIWLGLVLFAVLIGGVTGRMKEVTEGAFTMAETAVMKLALPLIGMFSLWLGIMRLAEKAGLIKALARALNPLMRRLFPDVPEGHPAMGAMLMNMAANMLGLSNAATPLGLRAMRLLETLNPRPGTATNAMCTFLAINTSSIQLLPTTAIAILAVNGSKDPTAIVGTALLATICSTIAGVSAVKWLEKLPGFRLAPATASELAEKTGMPADATAEAVIEEPIPAPLRLGGKLALFAFAAFFTGIIAWMIVSPGGYHTAICDVRTALFPNEALPPAPDTKLITNSFTRIIAPISLLAVPFFLAFFPLYAATRGVKVYEEFVEGAKEGFQTAIRIIPFLVGILVAIGMFRGAGGIELLKSLLQPLLTPLGFPPDLLPMVLVRPLSGSATTGLFTEMVTRLGPDDIITRMAATIFGSTETTFYVIAVYFGSVAIRRTRHAIAAGLIADLAGVIASIAICRVMFSA